MKLIGMLALAFAAMAADPGRMPSKATTSPSTAACVQKPCSGATNFTYWLLGTPDTRPWNWGMQDSQYETKTFAPPPGYAVRILRVYGTVMAYPIVAGCITFGALTLNGAVPPGTSAGLLFALNSSQAAPSGSADLDATTFLYFEYASNGNTVNAHFDTDTSVGGLLGSDNTIHAKGAIFTNTTGITFGMEMSGVVVYQFEPIGQ